MMAGLSYRHHVGDEPLKYITLGQLAEMTVLKYGNTVAVDSVEQNIKMNYVDALEEADKFAAGLRILGMEKGDRLGLWAPNCIEWYVVNLACIRAGILMVPLNPANIACDIEYSINKVGIKVLICPYEGKHNRYIDILMEILNEQPQIGNKHFTNYKLPSLKGIILLSDKKTKIAYTYKEVKEMPNQNQINFIKDYQNEIQPDDVCYIHFSSGTTGKPKAVQLSHFQIVNNSYVIGKRCELDQKHHTICVQVPFFHGFGTIVGIAAGAHFGATLVLPSEYYSSSKNFAAIKEKKCSYIYGTPTMFIDLINLQETSQTKINAEFAFVGAAPYTPELLKKMKDVLNIRNIKVCYGLTETATSVFISTPGMSTEQDTVGFVNDHLEVKVVNGIGKTLSLGEPGEICVRGYTVMLGYMDDEESTKKVLGSDGWFKTGDIGVLNNNGYARIIGRKTDLLIRGGENVYPKEIEDVLSSHPSIAEAQVIGIPNERLGEEICACIKLKMGCELTKSQVIDFCKNKLARYKIPSEVQIVYEFPKTSTGKIQKGILRELFCNGLLQETPRSYSDEIL